MLCLCLVSPLPWDVGMAPLGPVTHQSCPSSKPTPFQGLPAALSVTVTLLETPVFLGRTFGCPGNQADWGGGGEIHTQVLSCLVAGTPEGVRPALQGTSG